MIKMIDGGKNKKKELLRRKVELYKKNYYSNLYGYNESSSKEKAIFYGIKYISRCNIKEKIKNEQNEIIREYIEEYLGIKIKGDVMSYVKFLSMEKNAELSEIIKEHSMKQLLLYNLDIRDIKNLIANITYREFINIFPIIKDYDGKKFECKDYFSVMEYLNNINLDSKIGIDNIDEFFWAYYNNDIMFFVVNEISCIDKISTLNGEKTLMDRFLEEVDPDGNIHSYTYYEDDKTLCDRKTGETFKVKKAIPKNTFLKIVK